MKKIIAIFFATLFINSVFAQDIPANGSYTVNNTMTPFHGTWRWISGIDTVQIYLITQKVYYPVNGGFYMDNIVGWHLYKRGNQIIESSYNYINTPYANGHSSIFGGNDIDNLSVLNCSFNDLAKMNKLFYGTLTLNGPNKLIWKTWEHNGMRLYGRNQTVPPTGLTLPTKMVFTKL